MLLLVKNLEGLLVGLFRIPPGYKAALLVIINQSSVSSSIRCISFSIICISESINPRNRRVTWILDCTRTHSVCVVVLVENLKRLKRNFEVGRSMFLKNGFKDRDWIWATQNLDVELRGDFLLYNSDFAFFLKFVRGAF